MAIPHQIVYLDFSEVRVPSENQEYYHEMFSSALEKVENAFADCNVEFVLESPVQGPYSTLDMGELSWDGSTYLGIAEFDQTFNPADDGAIRLDNVFNEIANNNLTLEQSSNLISNTITHETGHLMGLDHTNDVNDIMHDGLTVNMFNEAPSFSAEQIETINTNATLANMDDYLEQDLDSYEPINQDDFIPDTDIGGALDDMDEPDDLDDDKDDLDLDDSFLDLIG